jgi:HK97 family phage prohead protease
MMPGCFDRTLEAVGKGEADVLALVEHSVPAIVGRTSAGNLRLKSDGYGLRFWLDLPATGLASDLRALVDEKIVVGMSFGFRCAKESWSRVGDKPLRMVEQAELLEVSAVSLPAYAASSCGIVRSDVMWRTFWQVAKLRAESAKPRPLASKLARSRSVQGGYQWR